LIRDREERAFGDELSASAERKCQSKHLIFPDRHRLPTAERESTPVFALPEA